jgi:hypothetical protein
MDTDIVTAIATDDDDDDGFYSDDSTNIDTAAAF